jgi:anti-anti-sigma factor
MSNFDVSIHVRKGYALVSMKGGFRIGHLSRFSEILKRLPETPLRGCTWAVFDFTGSQMWNSACLGVFASLLRRLTDAGWHVAMTGLDEDLRNLFDVVGFSRFVSQYATLEVFLEARLGLEGSAR